MESTSVIPAVRDTVAAVMTPSNDYHSQTYLERVLGNHRGKLNKFYAEHGEPKSDHEKIEALRAYLINAPKNLSLGNLELRLLWVLEALSETELSYFV